MKYLVTGGCGFIGSHLVEKLLEKPDSEVVILDNMSEGLRSNVDETNPRLKIYEADILGKIKYLFEDVGVVFHLAAKTRPQESIKEPELYNHVNIDGTLNVLNACRDRGVKRLVFVSSSSLYGTQEVLPTTETAPALSMSPYALTKLIGEQYCKLYERLYNLQSNYIRPFNVYGTRQTPGGGYAAAVPKFIDTLKNGGTPFITGDGEQTRDFVFVEDVVDLMILASEADVYGEVFNAGSEKNISINNLYDLICKLMGKTTKAKHVDEVYEPKITLSDMTKAKKLLGWKSKFSLEEGLIKTI